MTKDALSYIAHSVQTAQRAEYGTLTFAVKNAAFYAVRAAKESPNFVLNLKPLVKIG